MDETRWGTEMEPRQGRQLALASGAGHGLERVTSGARRSSAVHGERPIRDDWDSGVGCGAGWGSSTGTDRMGGP